MLTRKKFSLLIILSIFLFLNSFIYFDEKDEIEKLRNADITEEELFQHIKYLSSDDMEGRFPGTRGDSLTDAYLIKEFNKYDLKPFGENGYLQPFEMYTHVKLRDPNELKVISGENVNSYRVEKDFIPLGFSANGKAEGELVFAGYGITATEQNYDDYKDKNGNPIDIDGKILVMMRYSPGGSDAHNNPFRKFELSRNKVRIPKDGRAAGVIFFNGPNDGEKDNLLKLNYDNVLSNAGLPVVHVKRNIIQKIFSENGLDLTQIQNEIDSTKTPNSFAIKNVKAIIETNVEPVKATTNNVIGILEGNDPVLKNEIIVIGAHKDHIGYGQYGSLYAGSDKQIHNGADDNASGTAAVLEIAQKISSDKNKFKRSVLFMLFSGEEAGLLGSAYFTKSKIFDQLNISAMLNMDMVGRLKEDKLIIYGTKSSPVWETIFTEAGSKYNFNITYPEESSGRSDHASFYRKNIPSIHFFSGTHDDYHAPSDDIEKINSDGAERIANLVYETALKLNDLDTKPEFTKIVSGNSENRPLGNLRVYVGTIPDYSATVEGMKISGVKEGSPAEKGGMKAEDIIIKFGNRDVKNIYDYMYAMEDFKPGQEAEVIVLRNNEKVTLKVMLESR